MARLAPCLVVLALLPLGSCKRAIEKPTPPDMSALVAAYESPTGSFDQTVADDIVSAVDATLELLDELGLTDRMEELFADFRANTEAESEPQSHPQGVDVDDGTIRIDGEGFVIVERICGGWEAEPSPDPANGHLTLNVNVTDLTVDPVIWGTAATCRYSQEGVPIELAAGSRRDVGDLRIFVGNNLSLEQLGADRVIIDVDVTAGIDPEGVGSREPVDIDLAFTPEPLGIEVRVAVTDGDVVVLTTEEGIVGVRAANGLFTCDVTTGECQNDQGDGVQL